jgi:hypothetical protein
MRSSSLHGTDVSDTGLLFSAACLSPPTTGSSIKIDQFGIRGPLHTWLTSFLTERIMRVALEGEYSDEATVDSGVPQGTVLGPIL